MYLCMFVCMSIGVKLYLFKDHPQSDLLSFMQLLRLLRLLYILINNFNIMLYIYIYICNCFYSSHDFENWIT